MSRTVRGSTVLDEPVGGTVEDVTAISGIATAHASQPDAILFDIDLPDINGFDAVSDERD